MKNEFIGYYKPNAEEFKSLWESCIFSFDANTLLNVYRYSDSTRDHFLGILDNLRERIWLSHQAAFEYHEDRLVVINSRMAVYEELREKIDQSSNVLGQVLDKYSKHPLLKKEEVLEKVSASFSSFKTYLTETQESLPDLLKEDPWRDRVSVLFDGKVGQKYSQDDMKTKLKMAEERFKNKIPPGYEDRGKKGVRQYGDYILWSQLLDIASKLNKSVIFITDDAKEDWWQKFNGKTIGPRPELIQEMKEQAGVRFYLYQSDQFIRYAQQFLGMKVSDGAIDEAKAVREQEEDIPKKSRGVGILDKKGVFHLLSSIPRPMPSILFDEPAPDPPDWLENEISTMPAGGYMLEPWLSYRGYIPVYDSASGQIFTIPRAPIHFGTRAAPAIISSSTITAAPKTDEASSELESPMPAMPNEPQPGSEVKPDKPED